MAGVHQERVARIVCVADSFVRCLPQERRDRWYGAWNASIPAVQAYMEDLSFLGEAGGSSAVPVPSGEPPRLTTPSGSATNMGYNHNAASGTARPYTRKPCKFFSTPGGCRHGDACTFMHNEM
eukprot:2145486-Prymnesium_polylepis.1